VRYLYDEKSPRRRDEDIVAVRIRHGEIELRQRAKRLGIAECV
jgi:hypothetical protein